MKHIRQKGSSYVVGETYTLMITTGYGGEGQPPLEEHPCIVDLPQFYEITEEPIPEHYQISTYES